MPLPGAGHRMVMRRSGMASRRLAAGAAPGHGGLPRVLRMPLGHAQQDVERG